MRNIFQRILISKSNITRNVKALQVRFTLQSEYKDNFNCRTMRFARLSFSKSPFSLVNQSIGNRQVNFDFHDFYDSTWSDGNLRNDIFTKIK